MTAAKDLISRGSGLRMGEQTACMIRLPEVRSTSET